MKNNNQQPLDQNYLAEMLKAMQAQTEICKALFAKTNILINNTSQQLNTLDRTYSFAKKELKAMPILKDFSIRTLYNKYIEIRYRKHGLNLNFCGKDFQTAKQKVFAWILSHKDEVKAIQKNDISPADILELSLINKNANFKVFSDMYLENIKKKAVKPNTFKELLYTYNKYIVPVYGQMKIRDIRPVHLQEHLGKMSNQTPRLCETVKGLLNSILNYALDNKIIDRNPLKAIYIPKHHRKTGSALTREEEKEFLKAIENHRLKYVFLKMLYSGVRPCEIFTVQENIADNTITVKNGKLKNYQTNYYRTIPIFPMYKPYAGIEITPICKITVSQEFHAICPNHSLKDLRHTFTTRARECGIDNELVAVWTGHTLGNITSSVYTHFSDEFQQEQAKKLYYEL